MPLEVLNRRPVEAVPVAAAGLRTPGNLDPFNRKSLQNPDGSVSTTSSISIGTDEGEVLIPTVVDGVRLSKPRADGTTDYSDAIKRYHDTGQHLGIFDTPENADTYAESLHNEQASRMGLGAPRGLQIVGRRVVGEPDKPLQWSDYGREAMSTFASMGAGLGWLGEKLGNAVGIDFIGNAGRALKESGRAAADSWINDRLDVVGLTETGLSPTARRAMEVEFLGDGSFGDKWNKAKLIAIGSLPATLGGLGGGGLIAKGLASLGVGARVAGAVGYGLGEAGTAAPMSGESVERQVQEMTHDQLLQSPEYRATYEALSGVPAAERYQRARDLVAKAAGGEAAALTLVSTFLLSAPAGAILSRYLPSAVTKEPVSRMARAAHGAAVEGTQELFQSGTQAMSENQGMRDAGFDTSLWNDVLEQAVGGALSGAPMGGAFAASSGGHGGDHGDRPPPPVDNSVPPIQVPPNGAPTNVPAGAVPAESVLGEEAAAPSPPPVPPVPPESPAAPAAGLEILAARPVPAPPAGAQPPTPSGSAPADAPRDPYATPEIKRSQRVADARVDSLLEWVSKKGGISTAEAEAQGLDPADIKAAKGHGIRRPFTKNGKSFDGMAELAAEAGFPVRDDQGRPDANKMLDLVTDEVRGKKAYSSHNEQAIAAEMRSKAERFAEEDAAKADDPFHLPDEYRADLRQDDDEGHHADRQRLDELAIRARRYSEPEDVEWALEAQTDDEAERRLNDLIDKGRHHERTDQTEQAGPESPGRSARAPEDARQEGLAPAQPTPARGAEADLLGEDLRAQQALADETRRRDETRSPNRDVSLETGDPSDLFSQSRRQLDIGDVAPARPSSTPTEETPREQRVKAPQVAGENGSLGPERGPQSAATPAAATPSAAPSEPAATAADQATAEDQRAAVPAGDQAAAVGEDTYPYPTAEEMGPLREAFDAFFDTIETRETDKGTEMFSLDAPVASLSGDELGVGRGDMPALRDAARTWYQTNLRGKTATMRDGRVVNFNRAGMMKTTSKGEDLLRLVPAIKDIIEKGEIVDTRPGDRPAVKSVQIVAAPVQFSGATVNAAVIIRETNDGRFHYDLTWDNSERTAGSRPMGEGDEEFSIAPALEVTPDSNLNLFHWSWPVNGGNENYSLTPAAREGIDATQADLQKRLAEVGISGRVAVLLQQAIKDGDGKVIPNARGRYIPAHRLIEVAMSSPNKRYTMDHEIVHALKDLGVIRDTEWNVLSRKALADSSLMNVIRDKYTKRFQERFASLPENERQPAIDAKIVEEAVAELHAKWASGEYKPMGLVRKMFERIRNFFEALRNALRGHGFQSASDVFARIGSGEMGGRQDGGGSQSNPMFQLGEGSSTPDADSTASEGATDTQLRRFLDEAVFRFQDKFNYLNKVQKEAARERGISELPEAEDAYLAELRYHGMAGAAIEDFQRQHVEPLVKAISQSGLTIQDVDRYLHARHAPEANAQLARINPEREDNAALSGMSDADAASAIADFKKAGKLEALDGLAARVDAITKAQRDLLVSSGLESADTVKKWEETYKHYAPLHREGFDTVSPGRGKGFSVAGRQKRRAGSTRAVEHVLAHVVAQYETTAVRAEKNKVSTALLEFAKNNPNADLYDVDKVEYKPAFDSDGLVTMRPQKGFALADNVVVAKVEGKDHTITFNQRSREAMRIAHAVKNLGADHSGSLVNILTRMTRFLALVNTGVNPEFIISNPLRDLQTAGYNLSATDADKLKWQIIRDVGKAWRGIRAFQNGKHHAWAEHFDAFRKAGAQTGWTEFYKGIADREKKLVTMVEEMRSGSLKVSIKHGLRAVEQFIEDENTAVENAIRLSAFVHSRKAGISEAKSARIAKEMTVNFNRKGDYGQAMNALYLFYNASIQGSARVIAAAAKSSKVRKLMGGTIVAAMLLDILNRAIGGADDDDKDRYDKIPDYEKERNLIIMLPDRAGDYLKIPLPWGYNVLHVLGQTMGEALTKRNFKPSQAAARVFSSAFGAFNPIGSEATILQMVSPTITDPLVQWGENKDWTGRKLRPDQSSFDVPKPDSQRYWNSVREPSRWITEKLNELTGGSDVRSGAIDISPEAIDLVIDTFTGGAGKFVSDVFSTPIKAIKGQDVESREIPLVRRVYGRPGLSTVTQEYYEHSDAVRVTEKEYRHYQEIGDREKVNEIRTDRADELALIGARKGIDNAIEKLRVVRRRVDDSKLPDDVKKARVSQVNEQIETLMKNFNRRYNQRVGG